MTTAIGRRYLLGALLVSFLAILFYAHSVETRAEPPSGRTPDGIALGILGTAAMAGAAAYSWRRRLIARASRPIEVSADRRKQLFERERKALEQLQSLQRQYLRNPSMKPGDVRRDARKILDEHGVRRTIRARVDARRGTAGRLVLERKEWGGRLQVWYQAHLSLGLLSALLILLHSGFRFGNVVATLAFVCLLGVVVTGIVGVAFYWFIPPVLTIIEERAERTPEELRDELAQVVQELQELAAGKSDAFLRVYQQEVSIPEVSMKPSVSWLWEPSAIERDTARPDRLRLVVKEIPPSEQEDFRKAMRLVFRKEKIEVSLYPQLRYDYLLKVWLTAHIPLSAGMWGFSAVHVLSVLYF